VTRLYQVRFEVHQSSDPGRTRSDAPARARPNPHGSSQVRFTPSAATPLALTPWRDWDGQPAPPQRSPRSDKSLAAHPRPRELACLWPITSPQLPPSGRDCLSPHPSSRADASAGSLLLQRHITRAGCRSVAVARDASRGGHLAIPARRPAPASRPSLASLAHRLVRGRVSPALLIIDHGSLARLIKCAPVVGPGCWQPSVFVGRSGDDRRC